MTNIELYADVDRRRVERFARRQARLQREARRERVMAPVWFGIKVLVGAAMLYAYLFFGCLWASM